MILTRAIIGGMAVMIILLGGMTVSERWKNKRLSIEVKNKDDAIVAYEQLLKVVPFNALSIEWKGEAGEDINKIINSDNVIHDGIKRL